MYCKQNWNKWSQKREHTFSLASLDPEIFKIGQAGDAGWVRMKCGFNTSFSQLLLNLNPYTDSCFFKFSLGCAGLLSTPDSCINYGSVTAPKPVFLKTDINQVTLNVGLLFRVRNPFGATCSYSGFEVHSKFLYTNR